MYVAKRNNEGTFKKWDEKGVLVRQRNIKTKQIYIWK
jgi:hypothetical protein